MRHLVKFSFLPIILLISFKLFAQQADKVEVLPAALNKEIVKKCNQLEIGKLMFNSKPDYPEEAKSARVGGTVEVEVKVGEKGNVLEILNVRGNKLFVEAAKNAALKAKFTSTYCDGQIAQINAFLIYNFIPYVFTDYYFTPSKLEDFTDIKRDSKYYESISFITENFNLAFGYGDNKFHPEAPLRKGDFVHFLRLTLDLLKKRADIANKNPSKIELFSAYNPQNVQTIEDIPDLKETDPYATSMSSLLAIYDICLVNNQKKINGKFPMTNNEVIDFWTNIFGKDAIPLHFNKVKSGDRIITRGEFALFLQETLYILTYKVLP